MTNYKLRNFADGHLFDDSGWLLSDPSYDKPSLVRAIYEKTKINIGENSLGIYKYADWLPVNRFLKGSSATVTYKSKNLASRLGLKNLLISFSGYWPEIGANMTTCSFKETEAYSVCARLNPNHNGIMVVASAGNTARAFAKVCSENNIPLLLVVPEDNLDALWFEKMPSDCVKLVCTPKGTDYFDAIDLSNKICKSPIFFEEGGARNVARRDGMATTVLSAAAFAGEIPDYYFQAIGSGTGTIAAWEANLRLIEDGRFGNKKMVLLPSQNEPFTPMYDAWHDGTREITYKSDDEARENALKIAAKVLSNRKPPYGVPGGLFDALKDTGGSIEKATNGEMEYSMKLFEECEGIDIHPAAGIAVAGMIKSIESGRACRDSILMLNITGGGEKRFMNEHKPVYLKPNKIISNRTDISEILTEIESLFT
jgi:cysteate synthase